MQTIENIILDLGGVIINIDPQRTIEAFRQMGVRQIDSIYRDMEDEGWFDKLERGRISETELFARFRLSFAGGFTDQQLSKAWDALLLDIPEERVASIRQLQSRYRLFLLSNTNRPHMRTINGLVAEKFGLTHLDDLYDKAYYSFDLGLRKPEPGIYRAILEEQNITPASTLFFDDTPGHLQGAANLGIHTQQVTNDLPLPAALKKLGLIG